MIDSLINKNILLIMPKFFGYERIIVSRMSLLGAKVTCIYEDMDEINYFYRFVNAYAHQYMSKLMDRYFFENINSIANRLDYVVLIRGEFLNPIVLETLKERTSSHCKYCMYQWDSVKNNSNSLRIKDYFDYISTFDPEDAKEYGWKYRPLFYIPELVKEKKQDIDVLYMCSLHSKRIDVLNKLKTICNEKKIELYKKVYSKKLIFYKRKYLDKREGYISADNKDISSKKMDVTETYKLYNRSRIVVDYTHPGQNGFTMRTIEALGCKKKLVTNNKKIKDADFYDSNNIYVYEGENIEIPEKFIDSIYHVPLEKIYKQYSIDSWLESIMNLT